MTPATQWHRFNSFVADTWQRTAALWWAQGITAVAGVTYGKLLSLFVSPAVLGSFNLQLAATVLIHGNIVSPLIQSYMSALQQYEAGRAKRFYTNLLIGVYGVALLGGVGYGAARGQWTAFYSVGWLIWLATCLQGAYSFSNGYFTAFGHLRKLALVQALNPLLTLLLFLGLLHYQQSVTGVGLWVCVLLLNGALWLGNGYLLHRQRGQSPPLPNSHTTRPMTNHLRHYATPLLLQGIFGWFTNYIDRFIVGWLMTETAVGYYSVGYGMGARVALLAAPLVTRMTTSVYAHRRAGHPPHTALPLLKKSLLLLWLMGGAAVVLLYLFAEPVGLLFLSEQYRPSFQIIPMIATAYLLLSSSQMIESTFMAYEKTTYFLLNSVLIALSNICLNVWLIPVYGIFGAALAMISSMFLQVVLVVGLYRRLGQQTRTYL